MPRKVFPPPLFENFPLASFLDQDSLEEGMIFQSIKTWGFFKGTLAVGWLDALLGFAKGHDAWEKWTKNIRTQMVVCFPWWWIPWDRIRWKNHRINKQKATPQKFNIAPEKWWLEDYFPIGKVTFLGAMLVSGRLFIWMNVGQWCAPRSVANERNLSET